MVLSEIENVRNRINIPLAVGMISLDDFLAFSVGNEMLFLKLLLQYASSYCGMFFYELACTKLLTNLDKVPAFIATVIAMRRLTVAVQT